MSVSLGFTIFFSSLVHVTRKKSSINYYVAQCLVHFTGKWSAVEAAAMGLSPGQDWQGKLLFDEHAL